MNYYTTQASGQRRPEGRMTISQLKAEAEQRSLQTGRTWQQEFDRLLQANPYAYSAYLDAHPAQTGRR